MRIGLISYEYAGAAAVGGIGTYVRNAAQMLAQRGHDIEVFTQGCGTTHLFGVAVHSVEADRTEFLQRVVSVFADRHVAKPFDVIEGPEYGADASSLADTFPELPLVVKLHTPTCVINEINHTYIPWSRKARYIAGGLRRGMVPKPHWRYDPALDMERLHTLRASEVVAPSRAILDRVGLLWNLPTDRLAQFPNAFSPPQVLLDLSPDVRTNRVSFLGRLEVRKGVVELAQAIPIVLAQAPKTLFRFIGRSLPHPGTGEDLKVFLGRLIGPCHQAVEFIDAISYDRIEPALTETDICVFPSVWENFPNVCLEAMAAARGVIGSSAGGMAEIIEQGRTGLLVPPRSPKAIAAAVVELLKDPERRIAMGRAARNHVAKAYSSEVIAPLQEASYRRAIAAHRKAT